MSRNTVATQLVQALADIGVRYVEGFRERPLEVQQSVGATLQAQQSA